MARKPAAAAPEPERIVRLSVDLPASLHLRFKLLCVANQQGMIERVRELVERDVAEAEKRGRRAA
jgi:hypothetical protein